MMALWLFRAQQGLGRVAATAGDVPAARRHFGTALETAPDPAEADVIRAELAALPAGPAPGVVRGARG
jgi:hypothetical protein